MAYVGYRWPRESSKREEGDPEAAELAEDARVSMSWDGVRLQRTGGTSSTPETPLSCIIQPVEVART